MWFQFYSSRWQVRSILFCWIQTVSMTTWSSGLRKSDTVPISIRLPLLYSVFWDTLGHFWDYPYKLCSTSPIIYKPPGWIVHRCSGWPVQLSQDYQLSLPRCQCKWNHPGPCRPADPPAEYLRDSCLPMLNGVEESPCWALPIFLTHKIMSY